MSLRIYILLSLLGTAPLHAEDTDPPQLAPAENNLQPGGDTAQNIVPPDLVPGPHDAPSTNSGGGRTAANEALGPQPKSNTKPAIEDVIRAHLVAPAYERDKQIQPSVATGLADSVFILRGAIGTPGSAAAEQTLVQQLSASPTLITAHPVLARMMQEATEGTLPIASFAAELGIRLGAMEGCFIQNGETQKAQPQTQPPVAPAAAEGAPPPTPVAGDAPMPTKNCVEELPGGGGLRPWQMNENEVIAMVNVAAALTPQLRQRQQEQQQQQDPGQQPGGGQGQGADPNQVANNQQGQDPNADPNSNQQNANPGLAEQQRQQRIQQLAAQAAGFNSGAQYNSTLEKIEPPRQPQMLAGLPIPTFGEVMQAAIPAGVMEALRPQFMSEEQRAQYAERFNDLSKLATDLGTNTMKNAQAIAQSQLAALGSLRQTGNAAGLAVTRVVPRLNMLQGTRSVAQAIAAGPQSVRTQNGSAISNYANYGISGAGRASSTVVGSAAGNALAAQAPDRMAGMGMMGETEKTERRGSRRAIAPTTRRAPASVAPANSLATKNYLKPKHFSERFTGKGDI